VNRHPARLLAQALFEAVTQHGISGHMNWAKLLESLDVTIVMDSMRRTIYILVINDADRHAMRMTIISRAMHVWRMRFTTPIEKMCVVTNRWPPRWIPANCTSNMLIGENVDMMCAVALEIPVDIGLRFGKRPTKRRSVQIRRWFIVLPQTAERTKAA
jgi:hypothetical protein